MNGEVEVPCLHGCEHGGVVNAQSYYNEASINLGEPRYL